MAVSEERSSQPSLIVQTRRLLHQHGLRARKGLAQHYLVDEGALQKSVKAAEISPRDIIIEVGPGLGVLTRELASRAGRVVAIELDEQLAAILKQTLGGLNVTIVNEDVLKVDPAALDELKGGHPSPGYKVVANLPYYITAPVLRHFLEATVKPRVMVLMVQKEVAQSISAKPGEMSILSVSVQFYGRPQIIGDVPARSFYPAPKVDSAILRIDVYDEQLVAVADKGVFFEVVRAGFSAARKQLANSLAQGLGLSKADAMALLERAGVDSRRRAETLSLEEWARLWQEFKERRAS